MEPSNKNERKMPPTNSNLDKVNYRIMISICDSDKLFAEGLKSVLIYHFSKKGMDITFRENYSPGMPADFVFFSVPSDTCNKCRTILEPATFSGTIFIPIKDEGNNFKSRSQRCKPDLESLAIYRNASVERVCAILEKVMAGGHGIQHKGSCIFSIKKNLTPREYEMVRLMRSGARLTDVGKLMGVNVKTVHSYKVSVMRKLGLKKKHDFLYWLLATGNFSE